jgi:(1->4)-alpha-D-glucan 1-alpha-D-glucosylmutase
MRKAGREAKLQTSWLRQNADYEGGVERFVREALADDAFCAEIAALVEEIAPYGASNSLAQTLLRLCSPGVSDLYQGSELWNLSLVDPDNRGEVDYDARRRALRLIRERLREHKSGGHSFVVGDDKLNGELLARYRDGWVKLYVLHLGLCLRRVQRELFLFGDYDALPAGEHLVAFTRAFAEQRLVCAVPRLSYRRTRGAQPFAIGDGWQDDVIEGIPAGRYLNVFDGSVLEVRGALPVRALCKTFPVALLTALEEEEAADDATD